MDTCTQCGAQLGAGRFCTNCGHPVDGDADGSWRTDTAERPRVTVPPAAPHAMPEPRFPLFADEPLPEPETTALPAVPADDPVEPAQPARPREGAAGGGPGWGTWLAGFGVLVLVASLGAWLLFGGDRDAGPSLLARDVPSDAAGEDDSPLITPDPEPSGTASEDPQPEVETSDLAGATRVKAPAAAPTSRDTDGNAVTYAAANMLDGNPSTTWRMPGDGTGKSITFRFRSPTVLRQVGLINGYAKIGRDRRGFLDWYAGNRRVQRVEWSFGGTTVTQDLRQSASMQVLRVDDVRTRKVTLRLVEVSDPGPGRASRNYTAISDVRLVGSPA